MKAPKKQIGSGKLTIAGVAREAGVAKSTVSRVLNGGYSSPEVKKKVQSVISRLGFSPSVLARNMSLGKSGSIGVVMQNIGAGWQAEILAGMESIATPKHYSLTLGSLAGGGHYDAESVMRWIKTRSVDGVVFIRPGARELPLMLASLSQGLPVILIGPDAVIEGATVLKARNHEAGVDLARHLIVQGFQRMAFLGGPAHSVDTQDRLSGLREGIQGSRLELLNENIEYAHYVHEDGVAFAKRWLEQAPARRPDVVVAANDGMALGFMKTVLQHGQAIPRAVGVAGFDDLPASLSAWPGLTSVQQPLQAMGEAALKQIFQDTPQKNLLFSMKLVVRESTTKTP
jgi:LacI family transcriptional regulator